MSRGISRDARRNRATRTTSSVSTATTPHAVQRAEQLSVQDFDVSRRGGAYDPPHLIGGNPLAMRRRAALIDGDERNARAFAFAFEGRDRHPHVVKVRTRDGDLELAQGPDARSGETTCGRAPITVPVRSYEEHVARALSGEASRSSQRRCSS